MTNKTKQEKWQAPELFERGCSLYQSGQFQEAAKYFRLLTLMRPSEGAYFAAMGHALKKACCYEEALPAYHTAVLLGCCKDADLLFSLSETLKILKQPIEALNALKEAIRYAEPSFKTRLKMIQKVWKQEINHGN